MKDNIMKKLKDYKFQLEKENLEDITTVGFDTYPEVMLEYVNHFINLQERIDKAIEYINKYEYQRYCPSPYEKEKYIMRKEKEGQDLLNILNGDDKSE